MLPVVFNVQNDPSESITHFTYLLKTDDLFRLA